MRGGKRARHGNQTRSTRCRAPAARGGRKETPAATGTAELSSKPRSPTLLETCDATEGMNACQTGMKTAGAASRLLPAFPKPRPRAPAPAERKPTGNRRSESALPRSRPGHLRLPRSRPRRENNYGGKTLSHDRRRRARPTPRKTESPRASGGRPPLREAHLIAGFLPVAGGPAWTSF